ncbi:hypothetical protein ES703_46275 [subsurface metagenome]
MGQSKFKWIFVMEDGRTVVVEATFDNVMEAFWLTGVGKGGLEPVAIIRGEFA